MPPCARLPPTTASASKPVALAHTCAAFCLAIGGSASVRKARLTCEANAPTDCSAARWRHWRVPVSTTWQARADHMRYFWYAHGQQQSLRTMRPLFRRGLLTVHAVGTGTPKAVASITDAGRQALLEATTGKVRLDIACACKERIAP